MKSTILLLLFYSSFLFSQNCNDFLNIHKIGVRYPWKYDIQSKSAVFFAGKSSRVNIICNEGKDYRLSFIISSQIMENVNIKVTDASGRVYFSTGVDEELVNTIKQKKELLLSLENQALKIKAGKKKVELEANINNLKLEISKYERQLEEKRYKPNTSFEFTPASTMELIVHVSANDKCVGRGCVAIVVANKISEKQSF